MANNVDRKKPSRSLAASFKTQRTFQLPITHTSVESSLFCRISDSHAVRGKARPAGNIGNIAKGRNAATGRVAIALRELARSATASLQSLAIFPILSADCASHWRSWRALMRQNRLDSTLVVIDFATQPALNEKSIVSPQSCCRRETMAARAFQGAPLELDQLASRTQTIMGKDMKGCGLHEAQFPVF